MTAPATSSSILNLPEVEMRTTAGAADNLVGGAGASSSSFSGGGPSNAVDAAQSLVLYSAGGNFSAANSPTSGAPEWWQYDAATAFTVDELMLYGADGNSPKTFKMQYWNGAAFADWMTIADAGSWGRGAIKWFRVAANEILSTDNLTNDQGSTSYSDGLATMGTHVTPTANVIVEGLTVYNRMVTGGQYQAVIYQVNASTGAFIALLAAGPVYTHSGSNVIGVKTLSLGGRYTMLSGTRYAICLRRVDGTGTTNADMHYYGGANTFAAAPITINGVWGINLNTTPGVGATPTSYNSGSVVWSVGVIWRSSP